MSWPVVKLGDVVSFVGGSQPPKSSFIYEPKPGYIRLLQIRDYKSDKNITYIQQDSTKKFCTKHDVMIGRYGPPVFQILKGLEGAYNVALMKAQPSEKVDRDYLYHFLKQEKLFSLIDGLSQRTSGQSGVDMDALKGYPMLLPPQDEQKRIATILNKADGVRRKRKKAIQLADDLLRSIFLDMFGDPMFGDIFTKKKFSEIATLQQGLQIPISQREKKPGIDRYKYLTVKYLNGKGEDEYIQSPRLSVIVNKDQVLMTRTGNTGQVISGVEGVFHNNFFRIDFDDSVICKSYLINFLRFPKIKSNILRLASTTTIPDLNHSDFLNISLSIPPMKLQQQFSDIESKALNSKGKLVEAHLASIEQFNSISQKAFAGEL